MDAKGVWLIGGPDDDDQPSRQADQATGEITPTVIEGTYQGRTAAQWLTDITTRKAITSAERKLSVLYATLAEHNGIMQFPGLFDLDGRLVPGARCIKNRKAGKWVWLIGDGPEATWFSPSVARCGARRRSADAAKGYQVGTVRRRAYVAQGDHNGRIYHFIAEVKGGAIEIVDDGSLGLAYGDR